MHNKVEMRVSNWSVSVLEGERERGWERKREKGEMGGTRLTGYYILCKITYIIESLLFN